MAKKWQDVEFVDYKERQRRRRLKKRQIAEDEITSTVTGRWNFALIGGLGFLFVLVLSVGFYFLTEKRVDEELKESKMFVQVKTFDGDSLYRRDITEEWLPMVPERKFYNSVQFRTGRSASLELVTFDSVVFKLRQDSEMTVEKIEIAQDNGYSKTNLSLEPGDYILDCRKSPGLLEVRLELAVLYTGRSLLKIHYDKNGFDVKVSAGAVKVERAGESLILQSGKKVSVSGAELGESLDFNALTESW